MKQGIKRLIKSNKLAHRLAVALLKIRNWQFLGWLSYLGHRRSGKPYFGAYLFSKQGSPIRHHYIQAVIDQLDGPVRALEIGSWAGGSAISIAEKLRAKGGSLVAVDSWEPYSGQSEHIYRVMDRAARSGKILEMFLFNVKAAGVNDLVVPIKASGEFAMTQILRGPFDFAFIDGSHYYNDVLNDLTLAKGFVRVGGVLCGDDLELQFDECDRVFAEECNDDFSADPRTGIMFHPGVTKAVHEVFGCVSSWAGFWAMKRTQTGWEEVTLPDVPVVIPRHLR